MTHPYPKDRNDAINWARNILAKPGNYVILDTETTGLGESDVIVELAIIDIDGTPIFDSLFKPSIKKRISKEASSIHKITMQDLQDASHFSLYVEHIQSILTSKNVIIYNADFDERLLFQTCDQEECAFLRFHAECAMMQYSRFVGQWNDYHDNYSWQKLKGGDHSALGDCLATLNVIKKMAAAELIPDIQSDPGKHPWWKFW
ncbi:MAG TPA: 3'-5' exonuclease [Saprospiraceae bacterium]|nr:3'-5' exonuclease [Saprospiraceae bacterium]